MGIMRTIYLVCAFLVSYVLKAQEINIVGGELAPAMVVDGDVKVRKLVGSGARVAGGVGVISSESIGKEIGSIISVKKDFEVISIDLTILKNSFENCKGDLKIYALEDNDSLECLLYIPIVQNIPVTEEKRIYNIIPKEDIKLQPGRYYISFSINKIGSDINNGETFGKEIVFPLYMKRSYIRRSGSSKLEKIGFNVGITLKGL
jgi:hypothetical protein